MIIGIDIRPLMDKKPSGVSFYLFNLLDNLFKIDRVNQYKLFYNSFGSVDLPKWDCHNVSYHGFHYPNKFLTLTWIFFRWPKIDRLIGGCDVFWLVNFCHFALSKNCRRIMTVHDVSFKIFPEFFKAKWLLAYELMNIEETLPQFDRLIAVSASTKKDLVKYYKIPAEKIDVVYEASGVASQAVNGKLDLPDKYILTLATQEPRKNLLAVVQSFETLQTQGKLLDHYLLIAGGAGWLNQEVEKAIKASRSKDKIKVLGYVSEADKVKLYQRASAFVYPSFYEGFGLPLLEAMQQGCPVVTSLAPATAEIAGDAALLVEPNNVAELAAGINQLVDSTSTIRRDLISRGLERVRQFSWETAAKETLRAIES